MNNKRKIKKSSQHEKEHNLVNIFKDKFLDLCFRLDNLSDSNANQVFAANEPRDSIVVDGEDLQLASAALPTDSCSENFSVKDQYRNTLPPVERWPDRPVPSLLN